MEELDNILHDRLISIYQDFIHDLDLKIAEIRSVWESARPGRGNINAIIRLKDLAHELETCSAPFSLFLLADRALKLEKFLTFIAGDDCILSNVYERQIELLVSTLETAVLDINSSTGLLKTRRWEPSIITPEIDGNLPLVYILETDHNWAGQLAEQLQLNYRAHVFSNYESLSEAVTEHPPKLILTDVKLPDKKKEMDRTVEEHDSHNNTQIPIIFIARNDDIATRLLAVRSGATWIYTEPFESGSVVNKIRELTTGVPKDPFRVMVISDDIPMAKFYAMVLGQEGMDVTLVDNPSLTLKKIEHSRPELILMNLSLPGLTALELTEIIRQEENFAGIAIVFLSDDANYAKQLTAINSGGDDFISLPVDPDYLVAKISARVSRARTLNTMNNKLFTALREVENQQFALDQHAIVSITNINGTIIHVNEKLCDISGYSRSELIGNDHRILNSGMHDKKYFKTMWSTIKEGRVWQGEICNRKKSGELYWVDSTIVPFIDKQSRPYQYVSINSDITAKKFSEQEPGEIRFSVENESRVTYAFKRRIGLLTVT